MTTKHAMTEPALTPLPMFTPAVLADVLRHHAQYRPQAPALHFEGRSFTYDRLARRTERAAARLWHGWGVRPGDRVAYLGFNHADQITLLFALARLGAMLVPLNYRLAQPEWQATLDDCCPALLLHDRDWAESAQNLASQDRTLPCHTLDALISGWAEGNAPHLGQPTSPALLVYTSGTTGRPKGAVHTQANLLANMAASLQVHAMEATEKIVTVLPLFHVGGLCIQTLPALLAGAQVILHRRFEPATTLACIAQDRPSLTLHVPATLRALVNHPDWAHTDVSCLRAVWAGSSPLPADLIALLHQRGVPVCNVYGATETGPVSIALGSAHAHSHIGTCGWPAPSVQVKLAAPRMEGTKEADGVGEILLKAPNVVTHYWPDLPVCDPQGWFHTGDLAHCAADGSYTVVGRLKDMVISGGENIYPAEIEALLATQPGVAECAVLGLPDAQWGEQLVAILVAFPGCTLDEPTLRHALRDNIARYKQPRRYVFMSALPKTALGKVQKAVLREMLLI
jgi:fatty-acyl-CoA synthase